MSKNKTLSAAKNGESYTQYADYIPSWSNRGATNKDCQMFCHMHSRAKGNR
ncbi:MAG: hypothetical protein SPK06_07180 [Kiritimatiellia bacterium]|nr:hypothetical protein [Kiritimatiellia bacterium]